MKNQVKLPFLHDCPGTRQLSLLAAVLIGSIATSHASTVLIDYDDGIANGIHDSVVANGDFSVGGDGSGGWTTAGEWTFWQGNDTDNGITGGRAAYLQGNGSIKNLTSYVAAAGDTFTFNWRVANYGATDGRIWEVGLVYEVGGTTTFVPGAVTSFTSPGIAQAFDVDPVSFTIPEGSAAIGNVIGIGVRSGNNFIEVDNFSLSVTPVPEPSIALLGGLGLIGLLRRRR